jgi:thymidylate synthase (FAD)
MLEFGDITVKFITNRAMTHELVRHRLCSFAQTSQRYVQYNNIEFIRPVWIPDTYTDTPFTLSDITRCDPEKPEHVFIMSCINAESKYNQLLKLGWRPEQARDVLPNATKTEIVMKVNAREMRHVLNLRCSKQAHPQMRSLMLPLLNELYQRIPVLFDDLYNKYFEEKTNN